MQVVDRNDANVPAKGLDFGASSFTFTNSASKAPYFYLTQSNGNGIISGSAQSTASFADLELHNLPAISDDTVLVINPQGKVGTKEAAATSGTSGVSNTLAEFASAMGVATLPSTIDFLKQHIYGFE